MHRLYCLYKDAIDYVCVSTPAAHEYYLNAHLGSAYGLDNVSERFDPCPASLLRSTTGIEGIFKYLNAFIILMSFN